MYTAIGKLINSTITYTGDDILGIDYCNNSILNIEDFRYLHFISILNCSLNIKANCYEAGLLRCSGDAVLSNSTLAVSGGEHCARILLIGSVGGTLLIQDSAFNVPSNTCGYYDYAVDENALKVHNSNLPSKCK
jgi:hypothetical protein